jgi:hypothetical protein
MPKTWPEVAQTKEEKLFFLGFTIDPEKPWRSVDGLAHELSWPVETVAGLVERFAKLGLLVQSPSNPKLWGYWERVMRENE